MQLARRPGSSIARVRASLHRRFGIGRADDESGVADAEHRNVNQVNAEAIERRDVDLADVVPLAGKLFVVDTRERDLTVLHDVDDHAPRRVVGRGGNEHGPSDFEQRYRRHLHSIGRDHSRMQCDVRRLATARLEAG